MQMSGPLPKQSKQSNQSSWFNNVNEEENKRSYEFDDVNDSLCVD